MKTNFSSHPISRHGRRGSALIVVMMLCLFTLVVIASFMRTISVQTRTGYRATLGTEARNTAEAVAEYALAEMNRRAAANPSFGASNDPLSGYTLSTAAQTFLAPGTGNSHVVSAQLGFKAGLLSDRPTAPMLIDPTDPVNALDPDAGKVLSVRSMNIFGTATTSDPNGGAPVKYYVSENVQVREQAWFNYAVFYNMDMEFHAGPNMDVLGPVHTNENAYVMEGGGNTLNFYSTLTAFKKILRVDKYDNGTTAHPGTVQCISKAGMVSTDLVAMALTEDSMNTSFRTVAQSKWKGFVQDQTFSVTKFNPPGLPAYVAENFSTAAVELRNNAYLMIEPQLSQVTTDADYGQKALDAENLKFSALSGFVIRVSAPTAIGAQPKWKLVVYQPTDTTNILSANNPPARDATTGKPVETVIDPFNDQDGGTSNAVDATTRPLANAAASTWKIKRALKAALLDAIVAVPYRDGGTTGAVWGNGSSNLTAFNAVAPANTATAYYPIYDRREGYIYPNSNTSDPTNGLKGAMHVLRIDLKKLNALLNDATGLWNNPDPARATTLVYSVAANYTGVVYVQFPLAPITASRFPATTADGDMIRPAQAATVTTPGYAVVLVNGDRNAAGSGNTGLPQIAGGSPDGFTIATNGPLYIFGNYNSDGDAATGSTTAPDSANESTALIAADTVTILSPNFNFQNSATTKGAANTFTEVSAAVVTGLVPTHPGLNQIWAGGVHNFIHYLEDWNTTYRYRGSLAALYESEVATGAYHEGKQGYWYDPPTRAIGYHQYLSQGRFPPGTPIKRTIRRMNLQDITAATYAAGPTKPNPSN